MFVIRKAIYMNTHENMSAENEHSPVEPVALSQMKEDETVVMVILAQ